jgi:hypothetical protein
MSQPHIPDLFDCLSELAQAVAQIGNTWRPDDPAYRVDVYRQIMMSTSYSYFACFHATAEHPDWAPLSNPVYTLQPNPDDIYQYSPIRSDLRVAGHRGTVRNLIFVTQYGLAGLNDMYECCDVNSIDADDFEVAPDGTCPTPVIRRVKLHALSDQLPPDTPVVTVQQRSEQLRQRVRAAQRRRRW